MMVEGLYSGTASPLAAVVVAAAGVVAATAVVAGADVGLEELLPELQPTIHADDRRISGTAAQCHRAFTTSRPAADHWGLGRRRWPGRWGRWSWSSSRARRMPAARR